MILHSRVVITDSSVYGNARESPTAGMYICNLFVAYFVFSPVNANKAIFFKLFFLFSVLILWTTVYIFMASYKGLARAASGSDKTEV